MLQIKYHSEDQYIFKIMMEGEAGGDTSLYKANM